MQIYKIIGMVLSINLLFTGCMMMPDTNMQTSGSSKEIHLLQLTEPAQGDPTAVITTAQGTITMVLYPNEAPNTVEHFKKLIKEGFYNNKPIFIEEDIKTIVSGASDEEGTKGKIDTEDGKGIKREFSSNLWHYSGAVSALGERKNKFSSDILADSRFFIVGNVDPTIEMADKMKKYDYPDVVVEGYKKRGGLPQYTYSYTVFGQVISGMDVVDQILSSGIDIKENKPANHIMVEKIVLSEYHYGDPVDFEFEKSSESLKNTSSFEESSQNELQ